MSITDKICCGFLKLCFLEFVSPFFVAFILKKEGWCGMISIVKKKNKNLFQNLLNQ